jgi:hypothetical protein
MLIRGGHLRPEVTGRPWSVPPLGGLRPTRGPRRARGAQPASEHLPDKFPPSAGAGTVGRGARFALPASRAERIPADRWR